MGFELVRGGSQCEQIRDAVEAQGRLKKPCMVHQGLQDRITARTATHDHQTWRRSETLIDEILRPTDRILDIVDTPLAAERLYVGFAVARAATMVDLQDGVAAGGKKLLLWVKAGHCLGGR